MIRVVVTAAIEWSLCKVNFGGNQVQYALITAHGCRSFHQFSEANFKGNTTHPAVYPPYKNAELFYGRVVLVNVGN